MLPRDEYILELLINSGLVEPSDAEHAKELARRNGTSPVDELIKMGLVTALDVLETTASDAGYPVMERIDHVDESAVASIPRDLVLRYTIFPLSFDDDTLRIAISNPYDFETVDTLTNLLHRNIDCTVVPKAEIESCIRKYYGVEQGPSAEDQELIDSLGNMAGSDVNPVKEDENAPIIRLVNQIIVEAYRLKASDIHIEPMEKRLRLRYRIDGVLQPMPDPPKQLQAPIIARIKIMSSMSIAEKRVPQDGRIQFYDKSPGQKPTSIDLRVSTVYTWTVPGLWLDIGSKETLNEANRVFGELKV